MNQEDQKLRKRQQIHEERIQRYVFKMTSPFTRIIRSPVDNELFYFVTIVESGAFGTFTLPSDFTFGSPIINFIKPDICIFDDYGLDLKKVWTPALTLVKYIESIMLDISVYSPPELYVNDEIRRLFPDFFFQK